MTRIRAERSAVGWRRLVVPGVFAAMAFCILCGLGVWQLIRLAGKDALIAEIEARTGAPPSPVPPPSDWPKLKPDDYAYRHVRLEGTFAQGQALVFRPSGLGDARTLGAGYLVMAPFRLASGGFVIVDRGFVPQSTRDGGKADAIPAGAQVITGLMRPPEPRGAFTPEDDPARGRWFTRDPEAIAQALKVHPAAPFSVDVDKTPRGRWPIGGQAVVDIPNDHLSYALTWFGLAATAAGVFVAFAVTRPRGPAAV